MCAFQAQQHYFDDPEGKIELPSSLKVETWRRPNEFITEKVSLPNHAVLVLTR